MVLIKKLALQTAESTGLRMAVRQSQWRQRRLCILCYHSISTSDEHEALPMLYMPRSLLRRRMQFLRDRGYTILPLAEALERLYADDLPPMSVAITFDDGTHDFADTAMPILEEFEIPATLYLTTYYCQRRLPIFDTACRYLLWQGRASGLDVGTLLGIAAPQTLRIASDAERIATSHAIYDWANRKGLSAEERNDVLRRIADAAGLDFDAFLASGKFTIMAPEQVAALPRHLIDIQLHTHRHRTPRDELLFKREIVDNRTSIARTGSNGPLVHFCYPSGDYSHKFLPWLQELGVTSATTCVPGLATRRSDPLLLPRFIDTLQISDLTFTSWLDGTADWLPRRRMYRLQENAP